MWLLLVVMFGLAAALRGLIAPVRGCSIRYND